MIETFGEASQCTESILHDLKAEIARIQVQGRALRAEEAARIDELRPAIESLAVVSELLPKLSEIASLCDSLLPVRAALASPGDDVDVNNANAGRERILLKSIADKRPR